MTGDTCPTCGQPLPDQSDDCLCGHSKATHNFTPGRKKAECSHFGPKGQCRGCDGYSPLVVSDG